MYTYKVNVPYCEQNSICTYHKFINLIFIIYNLLIPIKYIYILLRHLKFSVFISYKYMFQNKCKRKMYNS